MFVRPPSDRAPRLPRAVARVQDGDARGARVQILRIRVRDAVETRGERRGRPRPGRSTDQGL